MAKAYHEPKEEDSYAWTVEVAASTLNAIGIYTWFVTTDLNWVYALYMLLGNGSILTVLLIRLSKKTTTTIDGR